MIRHACTLLMSLLLLTAPSAQALDGDLDPGFGSIGQLVLTVDPFNQPIGATLVANDVAIQSDGKIVIAGYGAAGGTSEWIVVRLNANGSYDHTFGISQNGIAYFYLFGPADNQAVGIAVRPNGKIVVGVSTTTPIFDMTTAPSSPRPSCTISTMSLPRSAAATARFRGSSATGRRPTCSRPMRPWTSPSRRPCCFPRPSRGSR